MEKEEKYSMEDLEQLPENERLTKIGLIIANELHNIYSLLWKLKEEKK